MSISMIVKKAFRPGGSNSALLDPGSPFEASGTSRARAYRALGLAEDAPARTAAAAPQTYQRRDLTAQPAAATVPAEAAPTAAKTTTPRRTYARRDLTPKE